jgi:hypothetical protein
MPSLFEPETSESIIKRIHRLQPTSQRLWGKMTVSQMLAHLNAVMQIATGDSKEKTNLIGKLIGPFIKRVVMTEKPFKKDLPTGPNFIIKEEKDFEVEKQKLLATYNKFIAGGDTGAEGLKHPLFGKLTAYEWGFSQWKHYDHHLRQFGV